MNVRGDSEVVMFSLAEDTHAKQSLNPPSCDALSCLAGMVVLSQLGFVAERDMREGKLTLSAGGSSPEASVSVCCQSAAGSDGISLSERLGAAVVW